MIPPLNGHGCLPRGRHRATFDEVERAFVSAPAYSGSATRSELWTDLRTAVDALADFGVFEELWIGGSFLTSKQDPGDIDLTLMMNVREYEAVTAGARGTELTNTLAAAKSLPTLDLYLIGWVNSGVCLPAELDVYLKFRGYWDDWWQRDRDPRGRSVADHAALPKRGYVEVGLNDYV